MKDAEWIAQLRRCGPTAPSNIPSPEVMPLRLLTRRLPSYKQRQTQVKNEIHNLLQRTNTKLTSYLSDIFSKTGQSLLTSSSMVKQLMWVLCPLDFIGVLKQVLKN